MPEIRAETVLRSDLRFGDGLGAAGTRPGFTEGLAGGSATPPGSAVLPAQF
jgi:hypothetical protein